MNELHPDLKRLLKWAHAASPSRPEEAPFGFSGRVLVSGSPVQAPALFCELQRTAWPLTCLSLALILGGGLLLLSQGASSLPPEEFSSALRFLASNLTP
jgi:hypothetical protein